MHRLLSLLVCVVIAGCSTAPAPVVVPPESISFDPSLQVDITVMKRLTTGVLIRDLVVGEGRPVRAGTRVAVHFAGFLPDGTPIDQLGPPSPPVEFEIGQHTVIRGWESGMLDMRPGGQRQLVIPPTQAYGTRQVGKVPPNSTLVFVIKLVDVR